jgi:PAS domain S-box-containing protein
MQPAAQQRDDLFRLLVTSVRDYAIFLLDPTGHIMSWNEGAQRIKGYTATEIVGKHFSIFYPPREIRQGKPEYELRVATDAGCYEEKGWRLRKDGSRFWANVVITALRDAAGQLVGFAKVTRDLTERKQAEEERGRLLALEREARSAAESTLDQLRAIQSVTEVALTHLSLDDLLQGLLDRISEALAVDTVAVLLFADDQRSLIPRAAKGIEEEVQQGVRIPIGRGFAGRIAAERRAVVLEDVQHGDVLNPVLIEKRIRSLLGVPLLVEGRLIGVLHVGTLYPRHFSETDVSFLEVVADRVAIAIDHARLYDAARVARRAAEQADEAVRLRDEFVSVAAHELKTPVTSLRGFAELLLRFSERGEQLNPERYRRILQAIQRESERLSRLITQLLDTTRLDAGRLVLDRHVEDLTPLLGGIVEQARAQSDQHELVFTAPPALLASVDALRLEQVLQNLLDNAIKYSPNGGSIDIDLAQLSPGLVQLTVRDRGIGVPPDEQARIFERFHQAHAASHRSGLGLGLYVSRQIVEAHDGQLRFEAPEDGGSRFVVELPTGAGVEAAR